MSDGKLQNTIRLVDEANAQDPNTVEVDGCARPAELVYGERMSTELDGFCPAPSDHLRIAVRAQHLERWTRPRDSYPEGRAGYLKWRSDLKAYHAERAGELMRTAGYAQGDVERVGSLIRKERLKRDSEAQTLEDVACIVFLKHYASAFIAGHDDDKVRGILSRTARKMSPEGLTAASSLKLDERLATLLTEALDA